MEINGETESDPVSENGGLVWRVRMPGEFSFAQPTPAGKNLCLSTLSHKQYKYIMMILMLVLISVCNDGVLFDGSMELNVLNCGAMEPVGAGKTASSDPRGYKAMSTVGSRVRFERILVQINWNLNKL